MVSDPETFCNKVRLVMMMKLALRMVVTAEGWLGFLRERFLGIHRGLQLFLTRLRTEMYPPCGNFARFLERRVIRHRISPCVRLL